MVLAPKIWVCRLILLSTVLLSVGFGQPMPMPVRNLPEDIANFTNVVRSPQGWAGLTANALILDLGNNAPASVYPSPTSGELRVLHDFYGRWIVGGDGGAYSFANGEWQNLGIDDNFYSSVRADEFLLLIGRKAIYSIDRRLNIRVIQKLTTARLAHAQIVRGVPLIFAAKDGVFKWTGSGLVSATEEYPWALRTEVSQIQELPDGTLFAPTNRGLLRVKGTNSVRTADPVWTKAISSGGIMHASLYGNILVICSRGEGLSAHDLTDERELWRVTPEQLGGTPGIVVRSGDDVIIGASSRLYVLPDFTKFQYSAIPPGDLLFAHNSTLGPLIGLSTGVYKLDGLEKLNFPVVESLQESEPGRFIFGLVGEVQFGETVVKIPGRHVTSLARLDNDTVVSLQPHGAALVPREGESIQFNIPSAANSVAAAGNGEIAVGTLAGAYLIDRNGIKLRQIGKGRSVVFDVPSGILVFDSSGQVLDQYGETIATIPYKEVLDVAMWKGRTTLLALFHDGNPWVCTLDTTTGEWTALDLPLPPLPSRLVGNEHELLVAAPRWVLRTRELRPLPAPDVSEISVASRLRQGSPDTLQLAADEETVDISISAPRLPPWRNPTFEVRLNGALAASSQPGAVVSLPRLYPGASTVSVVARWASMSASRTFTIFRARPWWQRTPAFFLYATVLGVLAYSTIRLRTHQLERRAQRLQAMVDERTAELRKAQKAREEFFSTLSHEIRNPLNGVVGICEILEESSAQAIAPRERIFVRTLRGCADQLRSILDDVLDFARIDRGDIQVHEEPFELVTAIEGAARATDAGLTRCTLDLPPQETWVTGDAGKVRQIVTNLISNALKYGVPPEARVVATANAETGELLAVRIAIINTGPTIPAEEIEKIFGGFSRGTDAIKRRIAGTGIGLAVSRRMARALGGDLQATSHNGRTEFVLELKLKTAPPPVETAPVEAAAATSRALAIEDEQYNRLVLGHILGRMGYEVDWAPDGATAMERVRTGNYDLILTDYVLPDTNGVELARKMLAELAEPKPPIVAVTAYSTPEKMEQAKAAGISGFVTKPVSKKKLEAAILGVASRVKIRQSLDLDEGEPCDFGPLLRVPNGRQIVAEYANQLPDAWAAITSALSRPDWKENADNHSRNVHAFRSRILAVKAESAAEQVALLEEAVKQADDGSVERLIGVIAPLIIDITEAARRKALG